MNKRSAVRKISKVLDNCSSMSVSVVCDCVEAIVLAYLHENYKPIRNRSWLMEVQNDD